jgi:phosphoribosylformylglycinamidine synthase
VEATFAKHNIEIFKIGSVIEGDSFTIINGEDTLTFQCFKQEILGTKLLSLLDSKQSKNGMAQARFDNYKNQKLQFTFPSHFDGKLPVIDASKPRPKAAIIREKGSNSEREMANAMYLSRI